MDKRVSFETLQHSASMSHELQQRILGRIAVSSGSGCWEWQGTLKSEGYGNLRWKRSTVSAHKAAFVAFKGAVPAGLMVLHECDNPRCCNPDHLYLGSAKDNAMDMSAKGRGSKGRAREPRITFGELKQSILDGELVTADQVLKAATVASLEASGWNIAAASKRLDVDRRTLYRWLGVWGIKPSVERARALVEADDAA